MYTTVSYDNLDTYLAGLAANTQDTPYEIEISNVTVSFLYGYSVASQGTLQYALQNNATKYVSLKFEAPAELDSIGFMCYGCKSLVGIVVTGMENVTVAWNAFGGCNSLTSVDVSCMESLRRAHEMFNGCTSLASVDISAMMELTEVHNMFAHCSSLESITLPTMAGVTDAHNMFSDCTSLSSVDASGMTSLTDASYMFKGCTSLTSVDVSGMTSVTNVYWMFKGCTSLTSVDVSGMTSLTDAHGMFQGCTSLTSVDVSGMTSVTNANWMFNGCSSLTSVDVSGMTSVTNASHMFSVCTSFVTIDVSGMTSVTNAYRMFVDCDSLTSADVSGMTRVTDAQRMFQGCTRLTEIHGWSVPPTADMTDCFSGCTALEAIYVPEPSPSESSWRAWDIRKDTANNQSTVTVYNPDGTSNSVSVPSAGTYTMKVTDKVDELLFSPSEGIPAATIQKMLQTKAPITARDALDPTKDNFALLAKDRSSARTNVTTDVIEAGNKLPPTSEAVRAAIGGAMPVGIIISYPGSVAPAGWHLCIGETKLRSDYPSLMEWVVLNDLIGDGKLFGAGDGTTTFDFPDLRELVLVGAGKSARPELDATGHAHDVYSVGEFKDDQFQSHTHKYTTYNRKKDVSWSSSEHIWVDTASTNTDTPTGRIGTTTHGKQIGMNYIIKI